MKNRVQTTLVIALLCAAGAISIHADGSDLVYTNTSYIYLPEPAPLEAECKMRAEATFASCMHDPFAFLRGAAAVMECDALAECAENACLNGGWICAIEQH